MAPEWTPEIAITPELVARTVAAQFPDLAGMPVRTFASGWDNALFRVGEGLVLRFVQRAIAVPGALREEAVLRGLAGTVPLPVPHPTHVGTPTDELPWPFWGAALIPGTELGSAQVPDDRRSALAADLGAFLAALHTPAVAANARRSTSAAGVELPVDPMQRADPASVAARARTRLAALEADGVWEPDPRVARLLDAAATADAPAGTPVLVHGDLHVRHLLVDSDDRATGVIDWGDVCLGDPAVDLLMAFAAFVGPARSAFFSAYGEVEPARVLAARVLAVHVSAALAQYGHGEGMTALRDEALRGLDRAVR